MQQLCRLLSESSVYVPTTRVVSPQKIAILVEKRQCNADTFREIAATVRAAEAFLVRIKNNQQASTFDNAVYHFRQQIKTLKEQTERPLLCCGLF